MFLCVGYIQRNMLCQNSLEFGEIPRPQTGTPRTQYLDYQELLARHVLLLAHLLPGRVWRGRRHTHEHLSPVIRHTCARYQCHKARTDRHTLVTQG